jgi:hypothetical protein
MTFHDLLAAAERGAASVYHAVLATGADVLSWQENPIVGALVQTGVSTANSMLMRAGVPPTLLTVVDEDVHAALKALAAYDSTVPSTQHSIGALAGLAGSIAKTIAPEHAEEIAAAADTVGAVESGADALGLHLHNPEPEQPEQPEQEQPAQPHD